MSKRISPSSPWLLWAVTVAVFALYVFGAIVSFAGLYAIAPWLLLPPFLYWSFPLAVDLAILVYKAAEVILRNDERKHHKIIKPVLGSVIFTAVSSAGNIVHVVSANDPDPLRFWGGILFAGMIPWAVYLAASVLTDLIVNPLSAQGAKAEVDEPFDTSIFKSREELVADGVIPDPRGSLVKTQNFDVTGEEERVPGAAPLVDENNEHPPIKFYESDETDSFGVNMDQKRHDEFTREFSKVSFGDIDAAKRPDLSVQQEIKLEPFPETWGQKHGE